MRILYSPNQPGLTIAHHLAHITSICFEKPPSAQASPNPTQPLSRALSIPDLGDTITQHLTHIKRGLQFTLNFLSPNNHRYNSSRHQRKVAMANNFKDTSNSTGMRRQREKDITIVSEDILQ